MAESNAWTKEFSKQIIRSALDLGRKFGFDEAHAVHVAQLCTTLFNQLREEHQLSPRYEVTLHVAALLHEIGLFVSNRSYHKHSLYLIRNSELFGLGKKDLLLAALVARYHRRASPQPTHEGYATLDRDERVAVAKMAALLRVADALDESRSQRIHEIEVQRESDRLVISIPLVEDLSLENLALKQTGLLFEETFGTPVLLRMAQA
jgi:exopolyphosphatase/guanosine-5'-triphosphate,3'-diphosphate pyrophosphatase